MEIRALRPEDDRSAFRSGEAALDRFFHQYAGQNQFRLYLGVTYVAVEAGGIRGYATVSPRHVDIERVPAALRKKLPRYPIPVLGLARLAVDESARAQGVGLALLRFVMTLASRMADEVGCFGVVVDAKPDAVQFYEKYGFRSLDVLEGASDARPQPTVMWLPMSAIKKAGGPAH